MISTATRTFAPAFAVVAALAFFFPAAARAGGGHGSGADHASGTEVERGPHGGRLLRDGAFGLEIVIHEAGVPPELHVYPYRNEAPVDPEEVEVRIELRRFGGRVDEVKLRAREDRLVGDRGVEEPHSFAVEVEARHGGESHRWVYESFEGRTEIVPEAAEASGIRVETAGPATIRTTLRLPGWIVPNEDRLARVGARYPGVVREARGRPGERVAKGEVLAVVESNESMRPYEIRSPLAGTVLERRASPGETTDGSHELYVVADLSSVWLDLAVRPAEARRLRAGLAVVVRDPAGDGEVDGRLLRVMPTGSGRTQTLVARVEVPNRDGLFRPGLFAAGEVVLGEAEVPVAVKADALQSFRDRTVVYLTDGRVYQAMPVETGRRDGEWVEIRSGLEAGDRYAARGSFVVKADVGKSGASHDH